MVLMAAYSFALLNLAVNVNQIMGEGIDNMASKGDDLD